jgi:putative transposase
VVGIAVHSWYRWQQDGAVIADQRPLIDRPEPANKLNEEERQSVLAVCNSPRFDSVPPSQIVPILADEGRYLVSESTMYRVLRAAGQAQHRGRAANGPNQVWMWDVTWLPSSVKGLYYKLYLFEDLFSRYPVGWEVHDEETGDLAADLLQRCVLAQRCAMQPLVLHSDNGAPMKSYRLKAKMEALGITSSFSRPRVSNDNPFAESIFRTLNWYCNSHHHSGIQFVTPAQRHHGKDRALLEKRHQVYQAARAARPERWRGNTRNWNWNDEVQLNPDRPVTQDHAENLQAA